MPILDSTGLQIKTQNEYFSEITQQYLDIDSAWDLDPSSPDGLKIAVDAEMFANLEEALLAAYNSKDPDRASGNDLDALLEHSFITRQPGSGSTVTLDVQGVVGTVIPAGSIARNIVTRTEWATNATVTISGTGSSQVVATCTVVGPTPSDAGDISVIVNPISGWQSVSNPAPATLGTDRETDSQARLRRRLSTSNPGYNQIDSVFAAISNVTGVRHVKIYENSTSTFGPNLIPPHSVDILVDGGDDDDIAFEIYKKRNPGPAQHQSGTPTTVQIVSAVTGNVYDVKFSRPLPVDISLQISITNDGSLPGNAADLIKDAVIEYSVGQIDGVEYAFNQQGYGIGDDVIASQLFTPINSVIGFYGKSSISSISVNGSQTGATINSNQLSRWSKANISVTI